MDLVKALFLLLCQSCDNAGSKVEKDAKAAKTFQLLHLLLYG